MKVGWSVSVDDRLRRIEELREKVGAYGQDDEMLIYLF